jgi:transposase|tara:strand:- start:463 stop:789 length:327 start_codon:yes stop_codon:yes gene_type:complete
MNEEMDDTIGDKNVDKNKWKGGSVQYVDPKHTSQECRKCHYTSKENRENQSKFLCKQCDHTENADINASYNIEEKGRSGRPSQPAKRTSLRSRQQEPVGNCEKVPPLS